MIHALHILDASTPWQRLVGLLGKPPLLPNHALRLSPCRAVHTIGMRHAIDVVFVDATDTVCSVTQSLKPCRAAMDFRARTVFELRAGEAARLGIVVGHRITARSS